MEPPAAWREQAYDLLVIGGGINGAAIARDAAMRGLRVLIVEAKDWGWGTTAKSSKLAHGGLRYLELLEFGLVHEALQDRQRLFDQAPHLVHPLRFLYPIYPDIAAKRTVRVGLWLYDALSHGKSVPRHSYLNAKQARAAAPSLRAEGLKGAAVYYDGQIDHAERLVIENLHDVARHGGVAVNRMRVLEITQQDGKVTGAKLQPEPTPSQPKPGPPFHVAARAVINAAGPWADTFARPLAGRQLVRTTKGVHIAVPRFLDDALIVRANDGRTFFILPWRDTCYIGTTDTDYGGEPGEAAATPEDIAYLQESARHYVPDAPLDDILYTWAGVRPLVNQEGLTESNVTRRHILHDHTRDGVANAMSLQGGKLTTARSLAEAAVDRVCDWLKHPARKRHPTRNAPLPGGPAIAWEHFRERAIATACAQGIPPASARHLVATYGAQWQRIANCDNAPDARKRITKGTPHLNCEVTWAVQQEQAHTIADVMLRRTTLGLAPDGAPDIAKSVAHRMARLLAWDAATRKQALADYRAAWRVLAVPHI